MALVTTDNTGFTTCASWAEGHEYVGHLLNDVFQQEHFIPPGVDVKVKLVRNSNEFATMTNTLAATNKAQFQINATHLCSSCMFKPRP